jgi:hypothetical protein
MRWPTHRDFVVPAEELVPGPAGDPQDDEIYREQREAESRRMSSVYVVNPKCGSPDAEAAAAGALALG